MMNRKGYFIEYMEKNQGILAALFKIDKTGIVRVISTCQLFVFDKSTSGGYKFYSDIINTIDADKYIDIYNITTTKLHRSMGITSEFLKDVIHKMHDVYKSYNIAFVAKAHVDDDEYCNGNHSDNMERVVKFFESNHFVLIPGPTDDGYPLLYIEDYAARSLVNNRYNDVLNKMEEEK